MREKVFLVGPFIGELSWEFYQFAPYIIHLKKENPKAKFIIFTRPSRFDLYGIYADIFVPLKFSDDIKEKQHCFGVRGFSLDKYNILASSYKRQYREKFKIIEHICPDTSIFYYKLKWQYPRASMDYDFEPRKNNLEIAEKFVNSSDILIDINGDLEKAKDVNDLILQFTDLIDKKSSIVGCLIESIKLCKYVIGNLNSNSSRLALLLKKPLITINESLTDDEINLLNPYKTLVIRAPNIEEGVNFYESM